MLKQQHSQRQRFYTRPQRYLGFTKHPNETCSILLSVSYFETPSKSFEGWWQETRQKNMKCCIHQSQNEHINWLLLFRCLANSICGSKWVSGWRVRTFSDLSTHFETHDNVMMSAERFLQISRFMGPLYRALSYRAFMNWNAMYFYWTSEFPMILKSIWPGNHETPKLDLQYYLKSFIF